MKKYKIHFSAFTLVELIIVITILAILATIAFISFKNYVGSARDGNKLTTLSSIETGLSLYQVKTGNYPKPDDIYGSGNYSGALLSQVGYIGTGVIQAINMNKIPKDPIVDFEYTYGLAKNGKYYQVGTVLEESDDKAPTQKYASKVVGNYKGEYIFSASGTSYKTNLPSLIFTQTGSQDFGDTSINPKFVINNGGNLVKPYHENNNELLAITFDINPGNCINFTYSAWGACQQNNTQTRTITSQTPNGCTEGNSEALVQSCTYVLTANIITQNVCTQNGQIIYTDELGNKIGELKSDGTTLSGSPETLTQNGYIVACSGNQTGYVLKSVNEGSSTVGTSVASYGNYYQFGKSDTSWINGNASYNYDWKSPGGTDAGSANDWGVSNVTAATETWETSTEANKLKMRGPCPVNYHVPTDREWNNVFNAWGSYTDSGTTFSNIFKLPMSGSRNNSTGVIDLPGDRAYYWSSSPNNAVAYALYFHSAAISPNNNNARAFGLSVRCFKDW